MLGWVWLGLCKGWRLSILGAVMCPVRWPELLPVVFHVLVRWMELGFFQVAGRAHMENQASASSFLWSMHKLGFSWVVRSPRKTQVSACYFCDYPPSVFVHSHNSSSHSFAHFHMPFVHLSRWDLECIEYAVFETMTIELENSSLCDRGCIRDGTFINDDA